MHDNQASRVVLIGRYEVVLTRTALILPRSVRPRPQRRRVRSMTRGAMTTR